MKRLQVVDIVAIACELWNCDANDALDQLDLGAIEAAAEAAFGAGERTESLTGGDPTLESTEATPPVHVSVSGPGATEEQREQAELAVATASFICYLLPTKHAGVDSRRHVLLCAVCFLSLNGYRLITPAHELAAMFDEVTDGRLDVGSLAMRLRRHLVANRPRPAAEEPAGEQLPPIMRRILSSALSESEQFGHAGVGTEHLLLGLLLTGPNEATEVLGAFGVDIISARRELVRLVGGGYTPSDRARNLTPRARQAIDRAEDRATADDENASIEAWQLLQGIAVDSECLAVKIIARLGPLLESGELLAEPDRSRWQHRPSSLTASTARADGVTGAAAEEPVWAQINDPSRLAHYLGHVESVARLSPDEEESLIRSIEEGRAAQSDLAARRREQRGRAMEWEPDSPRPHELLIRVASGREAARHLTEANLRLVVAMAKRYVANDAPLFDLILAGNRGLLDAVGRAQRWPGGFAKTAISWIQRAILDHLDQARANTPGSAGDLDPTAAPVGSTPPRPTPTFTLVRGQPGGDDPVLADRIRMLIAPLASDAAVAVYDRPSPEGRGLEVIIISSRQSEQFDRMLAGNVRQTIRPLIPNDVDYWVRTVFVGDGEPDSATAESTNPPCTFCARRSSDGVTVVVARTGAVCNLCLSAALAVVHDEFGGGTGRAARFG